MIHQILKEKFGFDTFRGDQEDIVNNLIANNDALVLMPTGGGKSLCYQIPALCMEGVAIVISPLISLMQNQVSALKLNGIKAESLNSSLNSETYREIIEELKEYRIVGVERCLKYNSNNPFLVEFVKCEVYLVDERCLSHHEYSLLIEQIICLY